MRAAAPWCGPARCLFAAAGIVGAFFGSLLGKMIDGHKLLALFALVMLVIAALMLKNRARVGVPDVKMNMSNLPAIVRPGPSHRHGVRLLRHRRRLSDRAGADAGDGHADHERGQFLAGRGHGVRPTTAASYAWSGWCPGDWRRCSWPAVFWAG